MRTWQAWLFIIGEISHLLHDPLRPRGNFGRWTCISRILSGIHEGCLSRLNSLNRMKRGSIRPRSMNDYYSDAKPENGFDTGSFQTFEHMHPTNRLLPAM